MGPVDVTRARNLALDERLGTVTPWLSRLDDSLYGDYSADGWGLGRLGSVKDEVQRAVASDLILAAAEGVQVNLRELALGELDLTALVGPNGRTMPGPETTVEDLLDQKRVHRTVTDSVRAFGSTLDCLAAVVIGLVGLSASLHRASGRNITQLPELPGAAPRSQRLARTQLSGLISTQLAEPPGWAAWAMELRDAVVHRGHLTTTYLERRRSSTGERLAVKSRSAPQFLARLEPHLRATPWLPDILALSTPDAASEPLWLAEPAVHTISALKQRAVLLAEETARFLDAIATSATNGWCYPAAAWRLERPLGGRRAQSAAAFRGFNDSFPAEPVHQVRVHSRSAQRLALASRLQQRISEGSPT